jgi:rhamnulokinase
MPGGSSPGTVFVSTGSWVIVGVERPNVDDSVAARVANFSNEAGALGGTRFLKNVVGFWILEQCRVSWGDAPMDRLIDEAASVTVGVPTFDAGDHRFVNPVDMEQEIREATGLSGGTPRGVIVRSVLDSIVDGIARVVDELSWITGMPMTRVAVVGGGARMPLLHDLLATRTKLRVVRGSPEATALGNAVVQGIALGRFEGIEDARSWLETTGDWVEASD